MIAIGKKRTLLAASLIILLGLTVFGYAVYFVVLPRVAEERAAASEILHGASVGDTVLFGTYEQDGDPTSSEPIEWQVLDIRYNRALLLSAKVLDYRVFDDGGCADWESSSLKAWLSGDFEKAAFSGEERSFLLGDPFCLSTREYDRYSSWYEAGSLAFVPVGLSTDFALEKAGWSFVNDSLPWWLRTAGNENDLWYVVTAGEYVNDAARVLGLASEKPCGVRPAVWIAL